MYLSFRQAEIAAQPTFKDYTWYKFTGAKTVRVNKIADSILKTGDFFGVYDKSTYYTPRIIIASKPERVMNVSFEGAKKLQERGKALNASATKTLLSKLDKNSHSTPVESSGNELADRLSKHAKIPLDEPTVWKVIEELDFYSLVKKEGNVKKALQAARVATRKSKVDSNIERWFIGMCRRLSLKMSLDNEDRSLSLAAYLALHGKKTYELALRNPKAAERKLSKVPPETMYSVFSSPAYGGT